MTSLRVPGLGMVAFAALIACAAPAWAADDFRLCADAADPDAYDGNDFLMLRQGLDGWLFRDRADFRILKPLEEETLEGIGQLVGALRQQGTELVIVLPPTRGIVATDKVDRGDPEQAGFDAAKATEAYNARLNALRGAGALVPDILAANGKLGADFFLKRDTHWSAEGAEISAAAVAALLAQDAVYEDVPKRRFVTERNGEEEAAERMGDAAEKMCDIEIAPQRASLYRTAPVDGVSADSLLGEAPPPPIVLVGTSFSRRDDGESNFAGFLAEKLSADVLNAAVSGGGADAAMAAYLSSAEFQKSPPAILIWEFPAYADLPDDLFYRALGALNGVCRKDSVIDRAELTAKKGKREAFSWEEGEVAPSSQLYVQIDVRDEELRKFALRAEDGKGKTRSVWFDVSRLAPDETRRFFANLPDDRGRGLHSIDLDMKQGNGGKVTLTLCRRPDNPS